MKTIKVQRDSVCMADDMNYPHEQQIEVANWSIASIAGSIMEDNYLALIAGGLATWILRADRYDGDPLAVIAQQWQQPRFVVPETTSILDVAEDRSAPVAYVQYYCQVDPGLVFDAIQNGRPLPDQYGRKDIF